MTAGIPHPHGTKTKRLSVSHKGEVHAIHVPADHDGARVKVEFPDGTTAYTEGYDETERALQATRPVLPCPTCGAATPLSANVLDCGACGTRLEVMLKSGGDVARGAESQSRE